MSRLDTWPQSCVHGAVDPGVAFLNGCRRRDRELGHRMAHLNAMLGPPASLPEGAMFGTMRTARANVEPVGAQKGCGTGGSGEGGMAGVHFTSVHVCQCPRRNRHPHLCTVSVYTGLCDTRAEATSITKRM